MNRHLLLACGLLVCGLAMPLAAQGPGPLRAGAHSAGSDGRARASVGALQSFAVVDELGDRAVATGRNWRACFTGQGFDFLPALGKRAPRPYPLHVEFDGAARGSEPLATVPAERRTAGKVITMDRGSVVERCEARPEGLEQTFTLARRPAGKGDLVVRLRLRTELAEVDRQDGTLQWRAPGLGGVSLGQLTAVDATGQQFAGTLRRAGGAVELVVPSAVVDAAAYPLLLDPLFGTAVDALPNQDVDFPDVSYDATYDIWCAVWTIYFANGSSGVVGSVFYRNGLTNAYAFQVNQSGSQDSVRVTHIGGSGMFVMVWCQYQNNAVSVCGLALEPATPNATNPFTLDGPANLSSPALSGEATTQGNSCIAIWDDDYYGVLGCTITVDSQLQVSAGNIVQVGGGPTAEEPTISKQGGNPGVHIVSWVDRPTGLPGWVRAQVIDYNFNLIGTGVWLQNVPQDAARPAVDGDGFLFLCAWEEQEVAVPAAADVRGRTFTVGPAGITSMGPVIGLAEFPGYYDGSPDVAMLGDKFGLVYQSGSLTTPYVDDVYFRALARNGTPIGEEMAVDLTRSGHYVYEHAPRLIGLRDCLAGTALDDGMLVFADQDTQTIDSNIGLQWVGAMGAGGAITDLGGGCGPGGLAVANGAFALGNTSFQFELYGAQALAIPFLAIGFPGQPLTCGACALTNPVAIEFVPNLAGTAVKSMTLPGTAALLGITVEFQFDTFQVNYVGCPQVPGLAASNRITATLDY